MFGNRIANAALSGLVFLLMEAQLLLAQQPVRSFQQVDTEAIEMNRFGFLPKQVIRPKGKHFIYVRNVTGLRSLSLRLTRQAGAVEKLQNITADIPHWRELLDLTPGTYTLTEASHPSWTCTITIQP